MLDALARDIRDAVNADGHIIGEKHFGRGSAAFMHLCSAMDTLGDSTEALEDYERSTLGGGPEYLLLYGVLQAVILQQDSLMAINKRIGGGTKSHPADSKWKEIRDLRNLVSGHPTDKKTNVAGKKLRSFLSRPTIAKDSFVVVIYDETKDGFGETLSVDFGTLRQGFKEEAQAFGVEILGRVNELRKGLVKGD
jgi:hypothetical protein